MVENYVHILHNKVRYLSVSLYKPSETFCFRGFFSFFAILPERELHTTKLLYCIENKEVILLIFGSINHNLGVCKKQQYSMTKVKDVSN